VATFRKIPLELYLEETKYNLDGLTITLKSKDEETLVVYFDFVFSRTYALTEW